MTGGEHYVSVREGFTKAWRTARAATVGMGMYLILFALTVLIADAWSIVNVIQSSADTERKVLWTVSVIAVPVFGFIFWYFRGPKTAGKG